MKISKFIKKKNVFKFKINKIRSKFKIRIQNRPSTNIFVKSTRRVILSLPARKRWYTSSPRAASKLIISLESGSGVSSSSGRGWSFLNAIRRSGRTWSRGPGKGSAKKGPDWIGVWQTPFNSASTVFRHLSSGGWCPFCPF